jgi:crotonobetainyl-CoA:carnitine CoA-transferase CaiB-like acyl-CoA transferase
MLATSGLLAGITIGVDAGSRALCVAARLLADLGVEAYSFTGASSDARDDEWLGSLPPLPLGRAVDVVLTGGPRVPAHAVVTLSGSGETAAEPGRELSEAEACAAGGLAVAIGEPSREPLPLPTGALDSLVGAHVAAAAVAALIDGRRQTSIAATDVAAWLVGTNIRMYQPYGALWHRDGRRASGSGGCYPYGLFEASDGLFCLIGRGPEHWRALVQMIGSQPLLESPHLQDPRLIARTRTAEADALVAPWVARHTRDELTELMVEHRFPGGPVLACAEVLGLELLGGRWRRFSRNAALAPGAPFSITEGDGVSVDRRLDRLRVLDLAWVWSGPAASVALADLGAHVVKVESANRPDNTRLRGPSLVRPPKPGVPPLEATEYFHATNRGKHSVALDLKTDEGKRVLRALAEQADVIIENHSPGVMERWGIAPETVLESNPTCTFVSMRGFGDHPSLRDLRAYAPVLTSAAGVEDLVRYPAGPAVGAMTIGFSDALAASHALLLALAGIHSAIARGRGAAITLSQFEGVVTANGRNLVDEQHGGAVPATPLGPGYVVPGETVAESPWVSPGLFGEITSPWLGAVRVCSLPWRRDGAFPELGAAGPELGAHTQLVLSEWLGMEETIVERLVATGVSQ